MFIAGSRNRQAGQPLAKPEVEQHRQRHRTGRRPGSPPRCSPERQRADEGDLPDQRQAQRSSPGPWCAMVTTASGAATKCIADVGRQHRQTMLAGRAPLRAEEPAEQRRCEADAAPALAAAPLASSTAITRRTIARLPARLHAGGRPASG